MLTNFVEAVGYGLAVAFLWFVWAPLVLLGAAVLLVLWANTREPGKDMRLAAAVGASVSAAWRAFRAAAKTPEDEPVDAADVAVAGGAR
ncbi:hypothetical protein SAMN04488074_105115 [Lentzea albidocapillata subsp. violacea]|uniref:Uncharacterized protein n=1 Tax=Lentzea albidocapillata subsp. violacea TaxID=128104 RepID=A0A1G9ATP1_9PSEU|nr:hypothetical protein [Lentzea albidocapillata]SDK30593.1 hypothetical protein SAMN04488074_105115 [Lentzea albidocapillata subsp. violacea]